ncbi:MAG: hypothetical protein LBR10_06885 [Prevotellaceae bacterium]|jgi:predicted transposase/invertase (TIGR01784 family)|nr:hypothetical protein [Prevotellaceae bacterium]
METYNKSILEYDDVILAIDYAKKMAEEKGEKRGERKGRKEGRKEGKEEGRKENIEEIIRRCFQKKMLVEDIAEITNLSIKQINAILTK